MAATTKTTDVKHVRAKVSTKDAVTSVVITTDLTAEMFLGQNIVSLRDEKGVKVSPAFGLGIVKGTSESAPTAAGITFPYVRKDGALSLRYATAEDANAIKMSLGTIIEKAERVASQIHADYGKVVAASEAIEVEA